MHFYGQDNTNGQGLYFLEHVHVYSDFQHVLLNRYHFALSFFIYMIAQYYELNGYFLFFSFFIFVRHKCIYQVIRNFCLQTIHFTCCYWKYNRINCDTFNCLGHRHIGLQTKTERYAGLQLCFIHILMII